MGRNKFKFDIRTLQKRGVQMNKCLLFALLVTSTSVYAEWTKITDSDESSVYIDKSSLKKIGEVIEVNQLFNFLDTAKSPDNAISYKSSNTREAYNCQTSQSKTIRFTWYSENMGKGKIVYTDNGRSDYPWAKVPKGSLSDAVRREICK